MLITPHSSVILDANVLIPAALRDLLLRMAEQEVISPHWSNEILDEIVRNLHRVGVSDEQAVRLIAALDRAFPEALVTDYDVFMSLLPEGIEDRHVLAAALCAHAPTILTQNLKHFPPELCSRYGVTAQSPDSFLLDVYRAFPHILDRVLD